MNSRNISKDEESKQLNAKNEFENLKSNYFLMKIFDIMKKSKSLEIMKYNKRLQKRLNLNINNYKEYSQIYTPIEIELKLVDKKYGRFINISKEDNKYYHIYFDISNKEIKRNYLNENEEVKKIKIVIDYSVKSFKELFISCRCISSINFKKMYRTNITDMSCMFYECSSLKELNLSNFNTNNVIDMSGMFYECSSLKELNLNNFNTNNVTDMSYMFQYCTSLNKLNLSNFNTNSVTYMIRMFYECESLKELNLSNFNTKNVTDMNCMFQYCTSLEELNISNFNTDNETDMSDMFYECSSLKEINLSHCSANTKQKIKNQNKNVKII